MPVASAVSWKPWCGGVTASGAVVKGDIPPGHIRLVVSSVMDLTAPRRTFEPMRRTGAPAVFTISGLEPDTDYFYALEIGTGLTDAPHAHFKTFPAGVAGFSFAFASCARNGSSHPVFETIRRKKPLFFLHLGDLHYSNIKAADERPFRAAYQAVLGSPAQSALMREVPFIYMWDDHDYGPNSSDRKSPGHRVARLIYQEYVPHFPLEAGVGDVPVYQTFSVGRIRFIITDLRSERDPAINADGVGKSMMGAPQLRWFKEQLLQAKAEAALTFWVSTVPWIGASPKTDGWSGYATERRNIANFIKGNGIKNLCILAGDAHMLAADGGVNADYADGGGAPVPVLHGSPLDQKSSFKGGPYGEGSYRAEKGEGCFGWVEVNDDGNQVGVRYSGRNHLDAVKLSYAFDVAAPAPPF